MTGASSDDAAAIADEDALAWLVRLQGPGGAGHQEAFEAWYVADPLHADAYDRVLLSWERSAGIADAPIARARRATHAFPQSSQRKRFAGGAVAAAAVVAWLTVGGWPVETRELPLLSAAYASGIGEIRTVRLVDGSQITLDTNTAVQTNFTREARHLRLLHGRARFRVSSDPRPFVVDAGGHLLTGASTSFDVDMTRGQVAVASLEGGLEQASAVGSQQSDVRTLSAGQTLSFAGDATAGQISDANPSAERWTTGMLSFDDARLAEVIERANLYSDVKIVLADDTTKNFRFTGTFRPTDAQSLATMLAAMFKLRLSRGHAGILTLSSAVPR